MSHLARPLLVVASVLALPAAPAFATDAADTRMTFVFSDDNLLADPGETLVNSPGPDLGPRDGNYFPFENLNTRDTGQETLSHIVLYRQAPGFAEGVVTDAAFVLRTQFYGAGQVSFRDDGSYLRLALDFQPSFQPPDSSGDDPQSIHTVELSDSHLSLVMFPFSSDRFRGGYSWDLSWGGQEIFTELNRRPVPALKLELQQPGWYAFIGAKTTQQVQATEDPTDQGNNELATFGGSLAGIGIDLGETLTVELGGGYLLAGTNRKSGIEGEPVQTYGGSARISWHDGMSVSRSTDFRLYTNGPDTLDAFLRPAPAHYDTLATRVSLEGTMLQQTLGDPDEYGATVRQSAWALALAADLGSGDLLVNVDVVARSLSWLLVDVPGLDPFNAFPEGSEQQPELLAALSLQRHLPALHLTPGVLVGVQQPAVYRGVIPPTPNGSDTLTGEQTVVVRNTTEWELLPRGEDVIAIPSAKLTLRWDASPLVSIFGQALLSRDANQVRLINDQAGIPTRSFQDPWIAGFAVLAQARF